MAQVNCTQVLIEVIVQNLPNSYPGGGTNPPPNNPPPSNPPGGGGTIGSGGNCPEVTLIY